MKIWWTRQEKDRLTEMWAARRTVSEIAATLGKSETSIKNQRKALGLPRRHTGDLTVKVRVGMHKDDHALLRNKATRNRQTVPGRIRQLIREDLQKP